MKILMPWFIPIAIGIGFAGTQTAMQLRKLWGKGRRNEIIALVFIAWIPMLIWTVVALQGTHE